MCKASIYADKFVDAEDRQRLGISTGAHGLGTFHPSGTPATACAVCLKTGEEIVLSNIPADLQHDFGLDSVEPAVFVETPGSHLMVIHDLVYFPNHPHLGTIPVVVFADIDIAVMVTQVREEALDVDAVIGGPADVIPATGESREAMVARYREQLVA